jgi:hypothetical protein
VICVALLAWRLRGESCPRHSAWAAAAGVTLLILSRGSLSAGASETGMAEATALVGMAAVALTSRRPILAGILAAAACMTLLQAAPAALLLGALVLGQTGERRWRFPAALAAAVSAVLGIAFALGGQSFLDQVFLYHLNKIRRPQQGFQALALFVIENWVLVGSALVFCAWSALLDRNKRSLIVFLIVGITLQCLLLATRPRVFVYYFGGVLPWCALAVAISLPSCWAAAVQRIRLKGGQRGPTAVLAIGAVVCWLAGGWILRGLARHQPWYQATRAVPPVPLTPLPGGPASRWFTENVVAACQGMGDLAPAGICGYVRSRQEWLVSLEDIVDLVRSEARIDPRLSIFGDSNVVPQVALAARVPIFDDLADTNLQRFESGSGNIDATIDLLRRAPSVLVLVADDGPELRRLDRFRAFLAQRWTPIRRFAGSTRFSYVFYRRIVEDRTEETPPQGAPGRN